jgi:hypothetical protein
LRQIILICTADFIKAVAKSIYDYKNRKDFTGDDKAINVVFGQARKLSGKIIGQIMGMPQRILSN